MSYACAINDIRHGDAPTDMVNEFEKYGCRVDRNSNELTSESMKNYKIYMSQVWNGYSEYEIKALHQWIDNGGKVILIGGTTGSTPSYMNSILSHYNITAKSLSGNVALIKNFAHPHDITEGINEFSVNGPDYLDVGWNSLPLAWDLNGIALASWKDRIVVIADEWTFTQWINEYDNRRLMKNIVKYFILEKDVVEIKSFVSGSDFEMNFSITRLNAPVEYIKKDDIKITVENETVIIKSFIDAGNGNYTAIFDDPRIIGNLSISVQYRNSVATQDFVYKSSNRNFIVITDNNFWNALYAASSGVDAFIEDDSVDKILRLKKGFIVITLGHTTINGTYRFSSREDVFIQFPKSECIKITGNKKDAIIRAVVALNKEFCISENEGLEESNIIRYFNETDYLIIADASDNLSALIPILSKKNSAYPIIIEKPYKIGEINTTIHNEIQHLMKTGLLKKYKFDGYLYAALIGLPEYEDTIFKTKTDDIYANTDNDDFMDIATSRMKNSYHLYSGEFWDPQKKGVAVLSDYSAVPKIDLIYPGGEISGFLIDMIFSWHDFNVERYITHRGMDIDELTTGIAGDEATKFEMIGEGTDTALFSIYLWIKYAAEVKYAILEYDWKNYDGTLTKIDELSEDLVSKSFSKNDIVFYTANGDKNLSVLPDTYINWSDLNFKTPQIVYATIDNGSASTLSNGIFIGYYSKINSPFTIAPAASFASAVTKNIPLSVALMKNKNILIESSNTNTDNMITGSTAISGFRNILKEKKSVVMFGDPKIKIDPPPKSENRNHKLGFIEFEIYADDKPDFYIFEENSYIIPVYKRSVTLPSEANFTINTTAIWSHENISLPALGSTDNLSCNLSWFWSAQDVLFDNRIVLDLYIIPVNCKENKKLSYAGIIINYTGSLDIGNLETETWWNAAIITADIYNQSHVNFSIRISGPVEIFIEGSAENNIETKLVAPEGKYKAEVVIYNNTHVAGPLVTTFDLKNFVGTFNKNDESIKIRTFGENIYIGESVKYQSPEIYFENSGYETKIINITMTVKSEPYNMLYNTPFGIYKEWYEDFGIHSDGNIPKPSIKELLRKIQKKLDIIRYWVSSRTENT